MRAAQIIAGDKQITDLSPPGTNIGNRIVKNMRIAGSGVYQYHRREASLFGLDPSFLPGDQEYFYMYRPPEVLQRRKDFFARVPIITGRHVLVTPDNAKELAVGLVGDSVETEVDPKDGELYLYTTGTIVAGDGIAAYEKWGQLSVGYSPRCEWRRGIHNGTQYDAVLIDFQDVNHLLICPEARGGPQCMIMDSIDTVSPLERFILHNGGTRMSVFDKIFGKKPDPVIAGDSRVPILLQSIAVGADPATQVAAIKALTDAMKIAGDTKTTWDGYLDELAKCKDEKAETKAKAIGIVEEFYTKSIAVAGDALPAPKSDEANTTPTGKKDDQATSGDADVCTGKAGCTCSKCKGTAGDAKFEARLDKIEGAIDKLTAAVGAIAASSVAAAGDSKPKEAEKKPDEKEVNGESTAQLAGDSTGTNNKKQTVGDFMANLRG